MPSKEILAKKQAYVDALVESVKEAESVVFSDYQGIDVDQDTEMRQAFRKEEVQYAVVKNTLAKRAFEQLGITGLDEILAGPTAIAWSNKDVTSSPRLIKEYITKFKKMKMKGGIVDGKLASLDVIRQIADIPSKDVLYGQVVASLMFPIKSLAMVLNAMAEKAEEMGKDQVADLLAKAPASADAEASPAPAEEAAAPKDQAPAAEADDSKEEGPASDAETPQAE